MLKSLMKIHLTIKSYYKIAFPVFFIIILIIIFYKPKNENDNYYDIFIPIIYFNSDYDYDEYEDRHINIGLSQTIRNELKDALENPNKLSTFDLHESSILKNMEPEEYILGESVYSILIKKNDENILLEFEFSRHTYFFVIHKIFKIDGNIVYTEPTTGPNGVDPLCFENDILGKKLKRIILLNRHEIAEKTNSTKTLDYKYPVFIEKIRKKINEMEIWKQFEKD